MENIAGIIFVCVTMNHLGLISEIERILKRQIPIINCVKCSSFWFVSAYGLYIGFHPIKILAISFFSSYAALWLELLEGYIDSLYLKLYEKIYKANDNTSATDADTEHQTDTLS